LTIERYPAQSSSKSSIGSHGGASWGRPATSDAETAAPDQAMPSSIRSEYRQWNTLGDWRNRIRATKRGTGSRPCSPSSAGNWLIAPAKPIR
jgi:hypothetical protein